MIHWPQSLLPAVALLLLLSGCATAVRPVNEPIVQADLKTGYRFATRQKDVKDKDNLVVLAFSGGGTRAAAFSYGVLEYLRRTEVIGPKGNKVRLLDEVDVITGVSGGSFTALAYGLYGDKLFDDYDKRFLKRDVQGEIVSRTFSPSNWGKLGSTAWGRSELAAELYDEILFNGATFGDLDRGKGPLILASATDISTGARMVFQQDYFDVMCSNLNGVRLSRAASASSAVPVVLSPVTLNSYGGTCGPTMPAWVNRFLNTDDPPRPAARAIRSLKALQEYGDGANRPFIHLVDGGVSDNVGMRGVLDTLEILQALHSEGIPTQFDNVKRIIVFIVNSLSSPPTDWDRSEVPPGSIEILLKASGVPIDRYSYEATEQLKDMASRWSTMRRVRGSEVMKLNKDPALSTLMTAPEAEVYAIDVSFAQLKDKAELAFLNQQPTSVVLPPEAVDRLRAAAGVIIADSPQRPSWQLRTRRACGVNCLSLIQIKTSSCGPLPVAAGRRSIL